MNTERIRELAEVLTAAINADRNPWEAISIESALRQIYNEAVEECARVCHQPARYTGGASISRKMAWLQCEEAIRSLKLPEGK